MASLRTVGVIPARFASTRFPGKILAPVAGRPLIHWVLDRVGRARELDEVLVATDDDRIRVSVEAQGVRAVMTDPDHPSGTDRVAEAATGRADLVVNIQGDEPLIDPALIDAIARTLAGDPAWEMVTAATPIVEPAQAEAPSVVKVVTDREGRALYFSRAPIPCDRDGIAGSLGPDPLHWRHIGIYGYRAEALDRLVRSPPCRLEQLEKLEQLRALDLGFRIKVLETSDPGIGVDEPEDVGRVEAFLKREGLLNG